METASIPCKVHQCSKCPGGTEYYCVSCPCNLCPQCKENHVNDLQTIDHDVVSHHNKLNYIPKEEYCVRHPDMLLGMYCEPCELPVCFHCTQHKEHRTLDVRTIYKTTQQQHRGTIHNIRKEALFYRPVLLLPQIKTDFKICHTKVSLYQSEMLTKAQTLKHLLDNIQKYFMCNVFCNFDFKHRCLKQKKKMIRHIVSLQEYELRYVQPEFIFSALQFLSFTKTALSQIHPTLHTSQLSMTESHNKEDVIELLSALQITKIGNRRPVNQYPEECSCTFSNFTSTVEPEHVDNLADLLDPDDFYGVKRSWKSFAEDVLYFDYSTIVAIEHRTKQTFVNGVLKHLVAQGKKLGHIVLHFSHQDHFRKDVLELIQKIHSECLFCHKIFANSLKDTVKE